MKMCLTASVRLASVLGHNVSIKNSLLFIFLPKITRFYVLSGTAFTLKGFAGTFATSNSDAGSENSLMS